MSPDSLEKWSVYDKNRKLKREYPIDDIAFNQWIKLDFNGDGISDYSSPFQLRCKALCRRRFVCFSKRTR